jgi:hypothetical protein
MVLLFGSTLAPRTMVSVADGEFRLYLPILSSTNSRPQPGYQIGGDSRDVVIEGDLAFLGAGPRLLAVDISSTEVPRLLGRSEILPGVVQAVALRDGLAYLAAGRGGLQILDVSEPRHLAQVGSAELAGDSGRATGDGTPPGLASSTSQLPPVPNDALSVVADGTTVFVGFGPDLVRAFDLTDPASPRSLGLYDADEGDECAWRSASYGSAMDLALDAATLYVAIPGCGLRLVDVSDPERPREKARLDDEADFAGDDLLLFDLNSVVVADGYAYVAGDGLLAVDVSEPTDPRAAESVVRGDLSVADLAIRDGNLYAVGYPGYWGSASPELVRFDLSDLGQPSEVAHVVLPIGMWSLGRIAAIDGLIAVASGSAGGLMTVDASDPAQPVVAGAYEAIGQVQAVTRLGQREVLARDVGGDVYRVGVDDAAGLTAQPLLETDESVNSVGFGDIDVDGQWLYVVGTGLHVYDIGDIDKPLSVGQMDGEWFSYHVAASGDEVFLDYDGRLHVVDVSDRSVPREMTSVDIRSWATDILPVDHHVYVGEKANLGDRAFPPPYRLWVFDTTDPARPVQGAALEFESVVTGIAVSGDTGYAGVLGDGLFTLNLAELSQPRLAGHLPLAGGAWDVASAGTLLAVVNEDTVHFVEALDRARPHVVRSLPLPAGPWEVIAGDDMFWIADLEAGLLGYTLEP